MKTATLKSLGLGDIEHRVTFPIRYVAIDEVSQEEGMLLYLYSEMPVYEKYSFGMGWDSSSDLYCVGFIEEDSIPLPLKGVKPKESLIKIVKEHPLEVDNLKKCILTLVSSNSNWGMSMSEEDETFVNDILKRIEGEDK